MLTKRIEQLAFDYMERYDLTCIEEINRGLCVEFAEELAELISEAEVVSEDYIKDEENKWDKEIIENDYHSALPIELEPIYETGYHVWIEYQNKFYDAECKDGVSNLFDLPFYKRLKQKKTGELT